MKTRWDGFGMLGDEGVSASNRPGKAARGCGTKYREEFEEAT